MSAELTIISCFRPDEYSKFHERQLVKLSRHLGIEIICVCQDPTILNNLQFRCTNMKFVIDDGKGVYPAFNKALDHVEGKYFCFFNVNDKIEVQNTEEVIDACRKSFFSLIFLNGFYGDHNLSQCYRYNFKKPIKSVSLGMPNVHGATLFLSKVAKKQKFDTRFKTGADLLHINNILSLDDSSYDVIDIDWYTLRDGGVSSAIFSNIQEKYLLFRYLRINRMQAMYHLMRSILIKIVSRILGKYWYLFRKNLK